MRKKYVRSSQIAVEDYRASIKYSQYLEKLRTETLHMLQKVYVERR